MPEKSGSEPVWYSMNVLFSLRNLISIIIHNDFLHSDAHTKNTWCAMHERLCSKLRKCHEVLFYPLSCNSKLERKVEKKGRPILQCYAKRQPDVSHESYFPKRWNLSDSSRQANK
jgi:hypothetical protein